MSPVVAVTGEHPPADITIRVVRLEEWRVQQEREEERREKENSDFEARIRVLEAAHMSFTGKVTVLAVLGSALATGLVQFIIRITGH